MKYYKDNYYSTVQYQLTAFMIASLEPSTELSSYAYSYSQVKGPN
jgi:hypothetical protein